MKSVKLFSVLIATFILSLPTLAFDAGSSPIFESVLIIGSSVSADHSAPSPGKLMAYQAGLSKQDLKVIAKGGKKSTYHKNFIQNEVKRLRPDVTVAVDLFFHDFKIPRQFTPADEKWVREVVETLSNNSNLVILGTALGLVGLGGATQANKIMYDLEKQFNNVIVVDINTIFKELHSDTGYQYDINGVQMTLFRNQVMADYIHPNRFGCEVLTNIFIERVLTKYPDVAESQLPFIQFNNL